MQQNNRKQHSTIRLQKAQGSSPLKQLLLADPALNEELMLRIYLFTIAFFPEHPENYLNLVWTNLCQTDYSSLTPMSPSEQLELLSKRAHRICETL